MPRYVKLSIAVLCLSTTILAGALLISAIVDRIYSTEDILVFLAFSLYPMLLVSAIVYMFFYVRGDRSAGARLGFSALLILAAFVCLIVTGLLMYKDISGGPVELHDDIMIGGPDYPWYLYVLFMPPAMVASTIAASLFRLQKSA